MEDPKVRPAIQCKNTRYAHDVHPYYARKYDGYCLECSNAGVPEFDEQIAELKRQLATLRAEGELMLGHWTSQTVRDRFAAAIRP